MRIGIVCYPTYGGSGVIATELAIELAKRGHEVHLICHHRPVRLDRSYPGLVFHGAEVTPYPLFSYPFYTLSLASKLYQVIQEYGLECVHVHYAIPHTPAVLLSRMMLKGRGPKIITTLHGTDINLIGFDPSYRSLIKFCLDASDGITAVSNFLLNLTKKEFGIDGKTRMIYNFIDTNRFTRREDPQLLRMYAPNDERIITYISNFRKIKNIPHLIDVFRIISSKIPTRLLMIGDGPEMNRIESLVKEYDLTSKVTFLGEVNYTVPLLSISDLLLLTSYMESFGLTVLEAMSCEVAVITTNVGGLPEVVEDGVCGFLVEAGDIEGMANKAIEILKDKERRRRMGRAGRNIAIDKFSIHKQVDEYERYYMEVLSR
jgi:N-acetyl-alpha-D-glucosaminyl L-malate synthase BshA